MFDGQTKAKPHFVTMSAKYWVADNVLGTNCTQVFTFFN